MNDYMRRLALVKLLEIIGEASGHVSKELRQRFSDIEWQTLTIVRHILVHEYFGIDYNVIWNAIQNKIPALRQKLELVIEEYPKENE